MRNKDLLQQQQNKGHRARLRERFLSGGDTSVTDYELLELLLFFAQPRVDVKPAAKGLLNEFGDFNQVVHASQERLRTVPGIGDSSIVVLKAVKAAVRLLLREQVLNQPVLSCWTQVIDYCRVMLENLRVEQVMVIYVDQRHRVIMDEIQQTGTVDQTAIYPREILKRALELSASGIILVHNHPSGDPLPSQMDITLTHTLKEAAQKLSISLLDHLIIGKSGYTSFKQKNLI